MGRSDPRGGLGEALGEPAFCAAVRSAGTDADYRTHRNVGTSQPDRVALRQAIDQARAAQQFEVIKALMARDIVGRGHGNSTREEQPTTVAIVADTHWDTSEPCDERRFERVLEQ